MVLMYIREGNLRDYLHNNHSRLTLKNRITIFKHLCTSLFRIHEKDLIHCDLHSGNILIQGGGCFITDLGLCGPVDDKSSGKIYGITPYIAPEVFHEKKNTKESDIYSIGMLMWEIFAGHPPFDDRAHDGNLILNIVINGMRPPLLSNMPDDCAQMMQKCWDVDPSKRPTIYELYKCAENKLKEIYENENSDNNDDIGDTSINNNSDISNKSQQIYKSHPLAYHTSRILDDDITKSKELYNNSNNSSLNDLDINSIILNIDLNKGKLKID
jgi:serine/threonine protein kinase